MELEKQDGDNDEGWGKEKAEGEEKGMIKSGLGHLDLYVSRQTLKTLPFWKKLNITPNKLTTLGLLSSLFCLYALVRREMILAIIFLILRWYFDFADGLYARKYNQTSVFGDYYDHIVDIFFSVGLFLILFLSKYPLKSKLKSYLLFVILIFYGGFNVNYSCIEKRTYKRGQPETMLSSLREFCPERYESIFKYMDNSVLYIVFIGVIVVFCKYNPMV
jgi:phosphatidylglycerophosphate synthase